MDKSFIGKCYSCQLQKGIIVCYNWKNQKTSGGFVRGGWYSFCEPCAKILNMPHNRKSILCIKCRSSLGGLRGRNVCLSCCEKSLIKSEVKYGTRS